MLTGRERIKIRYDHVVGDYSANFIVLLCKNLQQLSVMQVVLRTYIVSTYLCWKKDQVQFLFNSGSNVLQIEHPLVREYISKQHHAAACTIFPRPTPV